MSTVKMEPAWRGKRGGGIYFTNLLISWVLRATERVVSAESVAVVVIDEADGYRRVGGDVVEGKPNTEARAGLIRIHKVPDCNDERSVGSMWTGIKPTLTSLQN